MVAPLEALRKQFMVDARQKVTADIGTLGEDSKTALKFVEAQGKAITGNFIVERCFFLDGGNSSHRGRISKALQPLFDLNLVEKDANKNGNKPRLKRRILELMEIHGATESEVQEVYDHIIHDLLDGGMVHAK